MSGLIFVIIFTFSMWPNRVVGCQQVLMAVWGLFPSAAEWNPQLTETSRQITIIWGGGRGAPAAWEPEMPTRSPLTLNGSLIERWWRLKRVGGGGFSL